VGRLTPIQLLPFYALDAPTFLPYVLESAFTPYAIKENKEKVKLYRTVMKHESTMHFAQNNGF